MKRKETAEVNGHFLLPKRSMLDRVRDGWRAVVRLRAAGIVSVVVPLVLVVVLVVLSLTGRIHFGG